MSCLKDDRPRGTVYPLEETIINQQDRVPVDIIFKRGNKYDKMKMDTMRNAPELVSPKAFTDFQYNVIKKCPVPCCRCGERTTKWHDATAFFGSSSEDGVEMVSFSEGMILKRVISFWFPCCMSKKCTDLNLSALHHIKELFNQPEFTKMRQCCVCGAFDSPEQKFMVCSRCKMSHYCSVECQKSNWPAHKIICTKK